MASRSAPLAALVGISDSPENMRHLIAQIFITLSLALPLQAQTITVFAAASLREAMNEIAQHYPDDVTLSFAGSGTLARQIAAGAPADAVVLAHRDWATWLEEQGLVLTDSTHEVAGGQLVLIGNANSAPLPDPGADTLLDALDGGRLAMGQRDGVPAGTYAREWLQHIQAWDALSSQLAETDNVRAALALVAQGAAPFGIVYASDALAEPRVKIVHSMAPQSHAPIRYPAAAVTQAGRKFVEHLRSPQAIVTFSKYGFAP